MYYPTVSNRVRVSGRDDEFIVVYVDHTASVADLCPMLGETAVEENVPFHLLELDGDSSPSFPHDRRLATNRAIIDSSHLHISQSHATVADLGNMISATVDSIRASRRMIARSDRIIAWTALLNEWND